jgi:hypothetical protein
MIDVNLKVVLYGIAAALPVFREQMSLKRSDFGVGAIGSFFNPLHVDDEVQVTIEATAPV